MRLSLLAGRVAGSASRALGRGEGVALEGAVALRLDPRALSRLATDRRVILVSGTNGKTTTTAMIVAALGADVASNASGANIRSCLVPALARSDARTVVLEVDELHLPRVIEDVQPAMIVALNLSRDQLDRMHEVARIGARWAAAWERSPAVILANASDPQIVAAAERANARWVGAGITWQGDSRVCPRCGGLIEWSVDSWSCSCGYGMPGVAYRRTGHRLNLPDGNAIDITTALPGDANLANAAMAIAAAVECGVDAATAARRIGSVTSVQGRYDLLDLGGRSARLFLAKNPAGWQAALAMIDPGEPLIIGLNARVVDGRDTSWLYDVDFTPLAGRRVGVTGDRRDDLALRLHYAGASPVVDASVVALGRALGPGSLSVAANYTSFMEMRRYAR